MNPTLNEIRTLIKYIKDKDKLTQREVSKMLGYTETYLSDVLNGSIKLSNKFVRRVKEIYGEEMDKNKNFTLNSQIVQLQAQLTALQDVCVESLAKAEKTGPEEIRARIMSRTIENLSKLIVPKE